jgi:hypothetical protein
VITDAAGIPLAVILSGGHRNDVTQLLPLLDAIPPIRGLRGRPRRRPGKVYADRGYDHNAPSPGSMPSDGSAPATNAAPTPTKP